MKKLQRLSAALAACFLAFLFVAPVFAAETEDPLKPADRVYDNGNLVLHKTAERIGPMSWEVTVRATIGKEPISQQKMEVVFVLDTSGSMNWCTDQAAHDAGSHEHDDDCYRQLICPLEDHTHEYPDCYTKCTRALNSTHYSGLIHKSSGTGCERHGNSYYFLSCDLHGHDSSCYLYSDDVQCGLDESVHITRNNNRCYYYDANGNIHYYETRLSVAADAINELIGDLPGNATLQGMVTFSDSSNIRVHKDRNDSSKPAPAFTVGTSNDNYGTVYSNGGTYIMNGVDMGIQQFSSNTETKKVLILLSDGEASDNKYSSTALTNFKNNGGTVFTIGFALDNANLRSMISSDGAYLYAGNKQELFAAFEYVQKSISAMMQDPMGSSVFFDSELGADVTVGGGNVELTDNTLFWYPDSEDNTFSSSTIEYKYVVNLKQETFDNAEAGPQLSPLNGTTYFHYGILNEDGELENMKSEEFPIPSADYSLSSLQVKWQYQGADIQPASKTEKVISGYSEGGYQAAFTENMPLAENPVGVIPAPTGANDFYRYSGTSYYSKNGASIASVADIKPGDTAAYVAVHEYELVKGAYSVTYQYEGDVPEGAPSADALGDVYQGGTTVEVDTTAAAAEVYGYQFSGWETTDATVTDGFFTMPSANVVFKGRWVKMPYSHRVTINYFTITDGETAEAPDGTVTSGILYSNSQTAASYDFSGKLTYNGEEYGEAVLESGNATLDAQNASLSGIVPADPTTEVVVNLYREVQTDASYTVTHKYYVVDPDGNETEETSETYITAAVTGKHGQTVSASAPAADTDGSTAAYTYTETARSEDITLDKASQQNITITYKRYQYKVTTEGDAGVATITGETVYNAGEDASVSYTLKDGYELDKITVDGVESSELSFAAIDQNHHVSVTTKKSEYKLYVRHVFEDGSVHEGYSSDYALYDENTYNFDSSWSVTATAAPANYSFASTKSGVAVSSADDTIASSALSGEGDFGAGDKYVVLVYTEKPNYMVVANYFTNTDGEGYVQDNASEVILLDITHSTEASVSYDFSGDLTYGGNTYGSPALDETGAAGTIEGSTVTGIVPGNDTPKVIINLYREVQTDASYTVTHKYYVVDPDGNETEETSETYTTAAVTGKHGQTVSASAPAADTDGSTAAYTYTETARSEDITLDKASQQNITITYKRYQYKVTTEGDAGVATITGETVYNAGEDASVSYTLKDGYELDKITVDGVESSELSFAAIDQNHHVFVTTKKSEYKLYVKHVFEDGSVHEGYSSDYTLYDENTYNFDSSWSVTATAAPANYSFASTKSGVAVSSTDDTIASSALSGEGDFGAGDKYVVLVYTEKPNYMVVANYFTNTDGEGYVQDNASEVILLDITHSTEASVSYDFSGDLTYGGNPYGSPALDEASAAGTIEGNTVTGIVPGNDTPKVIINLYREVQTDASYTVTHKYYVVDPDGNETEAAEDAFVTDPFYGKHGQQINSADVEALLTGASTADEYEEIGRSAAITLKKDEPQNITITYKRYIYRVTIEGDEGVIIDKALVEANKGEDPAVTYAIKEGYRLKSITVDQQPVLLMARAAAGETDYTVDGTVITFGNIQRNHAVVVTTEKLPSYWIVANYYTITDDGKVKDNTNYVQLCPVTYTDEETVDHDFSSSLIYKDKTYGAPALGEATTGTAEGIDGYVIKGIVPAEGTAFIVVDLFADETTEEPDVTPTPTPEPTMEPTQEPTEEPTPESTQEPTVEPDITPTPEPELTPAPTPNEEVTPPTGDGGKLLLWGWMALLSGAAVILMMKQKHSKQ